MSVDWCHFRDGRVFPANDAAAAVKRHHAAAATAAAERC